MPHSPAAKQFVLRPSFLVFVVGCLVLVGLGWLVVAQPINSVLIEGTLTPAEEEAVQGALAVHTQQPLLNVDLDALVADVVNLSWPQAVTARRVWPDQLVLRIAKQEVVAVWQDGQYLTSNGNVVTLEAAAPNLPALRTTRTEPAAALEIFQRLTQVTQTQQQTITKLVENSLGEWRLETVDGMTIMLGEADHAGDLTQRLNRVYLVRASLAAAEQAQLVYADTRYTKGVAIRLHSTAATPNEQTTLIATIDSTSE